MTDDYNDDIYCLYYSKWSIIIQYSPNLSILLVCSIQWPRSVSIIVCVTYLFRYCRNVDVLVMVVLLKPIVWSYLLVMWYTLFKYCNYSDTVVIWLLSVIVSIQLKCVYVNGVMALVKCSYSTSLSNINIFNNNVIYISNG